jgi:predicted RND superfamily exporter protein
MGVFEKARGPWLVVLVIGLITALCAVGLSRLRVANDPQEFLPDHPTVRLFREVERDFGVASFAHVIAVRFAPKEHFTIESPQAIIEMEAVLQALRSVPGIISVPGDSRLCQVRSRRAARRRPTLL